MIGFRFIQEVISSEVKIALIIRDEKSAFLRNIGIGSGGKEHLPSSKVLPEYAGMLLNFLEFSYAMPN